MVQGWDIAQSSGHALRVSDEVVGYVRRLAESVVGLIDFGTPLAGGVVSADGSMSPSTCDVAG